MTPTARDSLASAALPRRQFLAALAGTALAACTGGHGHRPSSPAPPAGPPPGIASTKTVPGARRPLVVGCIAPFTGPRSGIGDRVAASLTAATGYIDAELGGSLNGYRPRIVRADAPSTVADGQKAYADLIAQKVDAILWCGTPGLEQALPDVVRDLVPVIAIATDLQSRGPFDARIPDLTTDAAAGFPVFQMTVPDVAALDLLLDYARNNRAFESATLLFSTSAYPGVDVLFDATCKKYAIRNAGITGYDSGQGGPDLTAQVQALKLTGAQVVVLFTPPDEAATAVTILDALGARYIDTPTAKEPAWKPMVVGGPRSVGDGLFGRGAGAHVAPGTLSVGYLGGFAGLPHSPIRDWLRTYAKDYKQQGGEDVPADALAALLNAAAKAASVAGADLVAALESGVETQFASSVPFHFGPDRHLAGSADDLVVTSSEVVGETRYSLGQEWAQGLLPGGFPGPDLLVDFTAEHNRRAHPDIVAALLAGRYGTSSRADYQGGDPAKITACTAVH